MDLQDRYDELDTIVSNLDYIVDEISDKYYIDILNEIKFDAQNEMEEIEEYLQEKYEQEEKAMNYEFERSRV